MDILVVDDDRTSRVYLAKFLERAGNRVMEAASGTEALQMMAAISPQVVITDLKMPGLSGLDLLKSLRQMPEKQDMAVILVTAFGTEEIEAEAVALGVSAYLTKPVHLQTLLEVLSRLTSQGSD